METPATTRLRIGAWYVDPPSGRISRGAETVRIDDRAMRLLLCLAERAGEVVSIEELLEQIWPDVVVTSDSVYQAVASLRRLLGDDSREPSYIATVPRRGYRMVAAVSRSAGDSEPPRGGRRATWLGVVAAVLGVALGALLLIHGQFADPAEPQKSVAVLPFLDLTDRMSHEEFADGMTEELIDKLSRVPGIHVASPTSSFYFRGKRVPVPDIARMLGVAYVLDGSVRLSGARMRVAVRLIRAKNGYVVWSESYDRPFDDALMVQDDIAGEVTKALRTSIQG
jgi:TolB-like protein/DNA-binding winged helix-turn-helix (wHTH) protein